MFVPHWFSTKKRYFCFKNLFRIQIKEGLNWMTCSTTTGIIMHLILYEIGSVGNNFQGSGDVTAVEKRRWTLNDFDIKKTLRREILGHVYLSREKKVNDLDSILCVINSKFQGCKLSFSSNRTKQYHRKCSIDWQLNL